MERIIGRHEGGEGPILVAFGAIHGNEPAGIEALRRVLAALRGGAPRLRGTLIGLVGNRGALAEGRRYRERDLNRGWSAERLRQIAARPPSADGPEDQEQRELRAALAEIYQRRPGRLLLLDLHSTSAGGPPFACMADTPRNRTLGLSLGVPVVLGLEEAVPGTMLSYLHDQGHVAVSVEGGQHDEPQTADNHEAVLWLALRAAGLLADDVDLAPQERRLAAAAAGLPRVLEIRHRHVIRPGDAFRMRPGFRSFDPIARGAVLAEDRRGEIRAAEAGRVLLPLYQAQGDDGFFLARAVSPRWLDVATAAQRAGGHRLLRGLPGVERLSDGGEDRLRVAPGGALWREATMGLMHLCGYRRLWREEGAAIFVRRRPDELPPESP